MPIFNLAVIFIFEFRINHIIYIFTSTCYLQSTSLYHYLNTFSAETLTWASPGFLSYVFSSSSLRHCHSQDSRMCRMLLLTTSKVAQLHYCYCLRQTPSFKTHFKNTFKNVFQTYLTNALLS